MSPLPLDGMHVLVVDDEPTVRGLYVTFLQQVGATVTSSGSATEAVQLTDLNPPDVVVTDLRMPGHDGIWLLRELKARMPAVPVIVVSGNLDARPEHFRELGFSGVLRKPLLLSQLEAAILDVVRPRGERGDRG
jgi:CheY-like chemotaxis protein